MKEHVLLLEAICSLKIDVPIMRYEINGDQIKLYLYGGQVKTWTPAVAPTAAAAAAPAVAKKPKKQ